MKIVSINVNGLKSFLAKDGLNRLSMIENPDVICIQESRCKQEIVDKLVDDTISYCHNPSLKPGYAGVLTLITKPGIKSVPITLTDDIYHSGRIIRTDFDQFILINVYAVNSGGKDGIRRTWDIEFHKYIKRLKRSKPVIIVGDLNVVSTELDYWGDYENSINSFPGLKVYEISAFHDLINGLNMIDSFREFNPDKRRYSWYGYRGNARARNRGWRLDYILVDERLRSCITNTKVMSEFTGSDHTPVVIELDLNKLNH